jgi:exopolysaccharide/PEP-CTERM locus tyrosine autokinase
LGKIFDALQKSSRKTEDTSIHSDQEEGLPSTGEATPVKTSMKKSTLQPPIQALTPEAVIQHKEHHKTDVPSKSAALTPVNRLDKSLVVVHSPHSYEAEQFRMLRANLLFPKKGGKAPRTLLVTSALPGEGKSFVSANLAAIIAQNVDHHVLLIDADMRNPTIHKLFGLRDPSGLSDYLNQGRPIPELLQRAHTQRLSLLPGGPPPSNPAELLSSRRMAALMQEVRNRYDDRYIIIDSPPPHITSESNALAKFVDGIVVVVKVNSTPRDLVTALIEKFEKEKVAGIVVNWMDHDQKLYYGADKYSRYYSRGKSSG